MYGKRVLDTSKSLGALFMKVSEGYHYYLNPFYFMSVAYQQHKPALY